MLARWASAGSESLLSAGPSVIERMWTTFADAEQSDTTEARLAAYEVVRQMVAWLRAPLDDELSADHVPGPRHGEDRLLVEGESPAGPAPA